MLKTRWLQSGIKAPRGIQMLSRDFYHTPNFTLCDASISNGAFRITLNFICIPSDQMSGRSGREVLDYKGVVILIAEEKPIPISAIPKEHRARWRRSRPLCSPPGAQAAGVAAPRTIQCRIHAGELSCIPDLDKRKCVSKSYYIFL